MDPNNPITYFAETDARNKKVKFGIKAKDRLRHMYVIGKTGMGKSTLLENLAIQDIQNGEGLAVIDPHGSMAEKLLDYVPEHRIKDVLYFAPFDMEHPIAFNVMEDVEPDKRHLVVNGLMATFEKIWADAWSARMAYILQYAIIGLLEYPDSSLLGINKMLSDKEYRKKVVDNITDASAKSFWIDEFGKYTERFAAEATPAIQNKVGQFTSNALVRNIVGQSKSSFDIREMMDTKKILIINLSKGQVGELNARLIGSMLITKIYLAAMSRADKSEADLNKLPSFYLYVDEFQSFANKSFADILSEARKYKLSLTIAHQYIEQMEEEVRDAVFGNVGTMVTFRVGSFDAEVLEKEFSPVFTAEDLVNLGFAQVYLKLMIDGVSSSPFSATTMFPIKRPDISFKQQVIDSSRLQFGRERKDVEEDIKRFYEDGRAQQPAPRGPSNGGPRYDGGDARNGGGNGQRYDGGDRGGNRTQDYGRSQGYSQPQQSFQQNRPTNTTPQPQPQPKMDLRPPLTPERELGTSRQSIVKGASANTYASSTIEANSQQDARQEIREMTNENHVSSLVSTVSSPIDPNKLVFAKAAEELKKSPVISQQSIEKKESNSFPTTDYRLKTNDSPKMSLNQLKPDYEKAKIPTKENMGGLKDALASVLKKSTVNSQQSIVKGAEGAQSNTHANTDASSTLEANSHESIVKTEEQKKVLSQQSSNGTKIQETITKTEDQNVTNEQIKVQNENKKSHANTETSYQSETKDSGLKTDDLSLTMPTPKEVPEDVLRKLLQVEEPTGSH